MLAATTSSSTPPPLNHANFVPPPYPASHIIQPSHALTASFDSSTTLLGSLQNAQNDMSMESAVDVSMLEEASMANQASVTFSDEESPTNDHFDSAVDFANETIYLAPTSSLSNRDNSPLHLDPSAHGPPSAWNVECEDGGEDGCEDAGENFNSANAAPSGTRALNDHARSFNEFWRMEDMYDTLTSTHFPLKPFKKGLVDGVDCN